MTPLYIFNLKSDVECKYEYKSIMGDRSSKSYINSNWKTKQLPQQLPKRQISVDTKKRNPAREGRLAVGSLT